MQLAWRLTRGSQCHRETPQVFAFLRIVQRTAPASTTAEGGARKPQLCAIDKDVPAISKGRPVSSSDPRQNLVQVRHQRRRDCGRAVMSTGQDSPDFGMQVQPLDPNKLLLPRASPQVQPTIYTALHNTNTGIAHSARSMQCFFGSDSRLALNICTIGPSCRAQ